MRRWRRKRALAAAHAGRGGEGGGGAMQIARAWSTVYDSTRCRQCWSPEGAPNITYSKQEGVLLMQFPASVSPSSFLHV